MRLVKPIKVFAVRDKDDAALARAASGGAFSVLARPILREGGIVVGTRAFDDGSIRCAAVDREEDLWQLQGSVYAQSDPSGAYAVVDGAVRSGRLVLFVGTPCQCAAMLGYLQAKGAIVDLASCDNLLLCDLICHGVPAASLYRAYLSWLGRARGADAGIHGHRFRSKRRGWGLYAEYSYGRKGKRFEVCAPCDADPYYAAFLRGETYRESCYSCPFARSERVTDVTIGDFWGVERAHPEFYDSKGISALLVNTAKGLRFFEGHAMGECACLESSLEDVRRENHNLNAPTPRPAKRDALLDALEKHRAEGTMDAFFDHDLKPRVTVKALAKKLLPGRFYAMLKRIVKGGR